MDSLYRTPLLDCFRRGEVAPDVRMLAAQGVLAPRAHEQLGLLVMLTGDADPAIRAAAGTTLDRIPASALARFLGRPDVSPEIKDFFAARGVVAEASPADDHDEPLVAPEGEPDPPVDETIAARGDDDAADDEGRLGTGQRLARMNVTQKIKAAMRGSREERNILIRDPNKLVSLSVLSSPKVADQEVEAYAKMGSVSEDVLRVIGTTRAWTKVYSVVRGLAFNPKTPIALSMGLVNRLVEKDVRMLAGDRNIPEPVKLLARKIMQAGQSRRH
ncbi:MAG: hypothetical protein NTY02_18045 [Acidobacteria bacterium]|nr:hypothetical protein [Acidobacteriota bacterium]